MTAAAPDAPEAAPHWLKCDICGVEVAVCDLPECPHRDDHYTPGDLCDTCSEAGTNWLDPVDPA